MPPKLRRRYLALKIEGDRYFKYREIIGSIWGSILQLYGEYGASKTDLNLIDYNPSQKTAILRTSHTTLERVRAALASITHIHGKPAAIHIERVSGTIKTLNKKTKKC